MKRLALVLAVLALLVPAAFAQANSFITASVPFDFFVGESRMQAGDYRVSYYGATNDLLLIANRTSGEVVAIISYREGVYSRDANPKLVFHNYDTTYFLANIVMPDRDSRELPQTRNEREYSSQLKPSEVTVVARLGK